MKLSSSLFALSFLTKTLHANSFYVGPVHVIFLDLITQIVCGEKQESEIFKFGQFVFWISVYCFQSNYTLNSVFFANTLKAVNYF
jgi:hypothetical protein